MFQILYLFVECVDNQKKLFEKKFVSTHFDRREIQYSNNAFPLKFSFWRLGFLFLRWLLSVKNSSQCRLIRNGNLKRNASYKPMLALTWRGQLRCIGVVSIGAFDIESIAENAIRCWAGHFGTRLQIGRRERDGVDSRPGVVFLGDERLPRRPDVVKLEIVTGAFRRRSFIAFEV